VEESAAQGHDAVRASTARWKSEWDDDELIPEEFADGGDRVVATVRFRARGRGSGIEVDARLYDVFTLHDGKIVRMVPVLGAVRSPRSRGAVGVAAG
jgi:ketosteroid isomerase-like protein